MAAPIGVFDSGYGGLTILKSLQKQLPQYDYIYLGDNARAPYGTRSFETVYEYTLEAVKWFFDQGCELVILACNTASAKALRNIQQLDLPTLAPNKRVLGVIRPSSEVLGNYSVSKQVGIMGTTGTVQSESYLIELAKFFPEVKVFQQACPMWVPIIENGEIDSEGADFFVKKYLDQLNMENVLDHPFYNYNIEKLLSRLKSYGVNDNLRLICKKKMALRSTGLLSRNDTS